MTFECGFCHGYALQVLYTIGGLENIRAAKKYYAATLELSGGRNVRALYGTILVWTLALVTSILIRTVGFSRPKFRGVLLVIVLQVFLQRKASKSLRKKGDTFLTAPEGVEESLE